MGAVIPLPGVLIRVGSGHGGTTGSTGPPGPTQLAYTGSESIRVSVPSRPV